MPEEKFCPRCGHPDPAWQCEICGGCEYCYDAMSLAAEEDEEDDDTLQLVQVDADGEEHIVAEYFKDEFDC